jgi:hypothetical protein
LSVNAQVTQGLVSQYCFDGNANDFVGSNNGTVNGATLTTDRFNNPNAAYSFDGFTGNHIDLGNSSTLKQNATSISVWVYVDSNLHFSSAFNYQPFIIAKNTNVPNTWFEGYAIGYWTPSPRFVAMSYQSGTQSGPVIFTLDTIQQRTWYHLALTFDNNNLSFYVNGNLQGNSPVTKTFATSYASSESVLIGRTNVPNVEGFLNGKVDDLRIYNRVISAAEVDTLKNIVSSCIPQSTINHFLGGDIQIYPNPSNGMLMLNNYVSNKIQRIELLSISGQTLREINPQQNTIDLNDISKGMYLIRFFDKKNTQLTRKVFID